MQDPVRRFFCFGFLFFSLSVHISAQTANKNYPASAIATAQAQLKAGDLAAANDTLLTLLSSQPDNTQALLLLGTVRGHQERFAEAEVLLQRVLRSEPDSLIAHRNLAYALLSQNKLPEAAAQYDMAATLDPRDIELKVSSAQVRVRLAQFDAALQVLASIPATKLSLSAVPVKAAALLGLDRRAEAEAQIPLARNSAETTMELAEVFLGANLPDDALKSLETPALEAKPNARYYYLRGRAFNEKGNLQMSLKDFRQALAQDPKSLVTLLAMAEIYSLQGNHPASASFLQKAQALDPKSPPLLRHLVQETMQAGQNTAAVQAATMLEAETKGPDDEYLLASVLLQDQQYDAAGPVLERYLGQRPEDARALAGLGVVYLNQRHYPEARKALEQALRIQADFPEAEYNLGIVAMKEGRGQDAISYLEKFVRQNS